MDAFKLLRKKFAQPPSVDGNKSDPKSQKGPKIAPKPKREIEPNPSVSKGATAKDTKDKPKDNPILKAKDKPKDNPAFKTKDKPKDNPVLKAKDIPKDNPVNKVKDIPKDNPAHKAKDKPKDNPVHKELVTLKPPLIEKKRIHVTEEKQPLKATPKSPTDRKSSVPEDKLLELQEAFVLFDKNQDGMITKEELGAVLHALGQRPTVSDVQALIHSVDLDKSGTIDFEEFVKIFSTKLSIDPEKELHEVFCIFDENGDGFISSDELYSMLHKLGEHITKHEAQKMINEADLNRDGKVDYREFKAILNAR